MQKQQRPDDPLNFPEGALTKDMKSLDIITDIFIKLFGLLFFNVALMYTFVYF